MKATYLLSSLLFLITNLLLASVAFVKEFFAPVKERAKGLMTKVSVHTSSVAHQAKAWMYAMFARQHVDSYGFA